MCAIQETHLTDSIDIIRESYSGKPYRFINLCTDNSHHGIGFVIDATFQCYYTPLNPIVCVLRLPHSNKKNLYLYNVYCPWKNLDENTEEIYSILDQELKHNAKNKFVLGDFNASIGSQHKNYSTNIGSFGKGEVNKNGKLLTDFLAQNNLYACNTFFRHKLAHVTTFVSNLKIKWRRNPIRKQIDFIVAHKNWKSCGKDARSYSGTLTTSDHSS